ncbi:Interferon-induced protein with tetratricopeptide repeats 2, partial [Lemmus lemmus]
STTIEKCLESRLQQLKCHFTWNLIVGDESLDDFEDRVFNKDEFQNSECKATMCNILAYVKHLRGQNEAALKCLEDAEHFIQQQHPDQVEIRSLVTWGNYAWIYYHMGQLSKAQAYLDKVREVCEKFSSPYRIESPELDCEEGWARLKCTQIQNERAKVCFVKALEKDPKNPEFTSGWAIASYRLNYRPAWQDSIDSLKEALRLSPDNPYLKVLLALKLETIDENQAGELVEEAIRKAPGATDVLLSAAKFYYKTHEADRAIQLLRKALECLPKNAYAHYHIGCCYRSKVLGIVHRRETALNENQKKFQELIQLAISHLRKAEEIKEFLENSCSYLARLYAMVNRYEEADYYFQKEFKEQDIHLRYGRYQQYHQKSEDKAITHYLKGLKIEETSYAWRKLLNALEKVAHRWVQQNVRPVESTSLLGLVHKLKGNMPEALLCYERALRLTGEMNPEF